MNNLSTGVVHATNRRWVTGAVVVESSVFRDETGVIQDERRLIPIVKTRAAEFERRNLQESITISEPLYQN